MLSSTAFLSMVHWPCHRTPVHPRSEGVKFEVPREARDDRDRTGMTGMTGITGMVEMCRDDGDVAQCVDLTVMLWSTLKQGMCSPGV